MKNLYYLAVMLLLFITGCGSQKSLPVKNYYTHKTECITMELDGKQTVRAWPNTADKINMVEQAKMNAVKDVLFGGIYEGKDVCEKRPVLTDVNAQTNNQSYFNAFFSAGGDYKKFAYIKDDNLEKAFSKDDKMVAGAVAAGFIITVDRPALKQKMIADGIIR